MGKELCQQRQVFAKGRTGLSSGRPLARVLSGKAQRLWLLARLTDLACAPRRPACYVAVLA